MNLTNGQRGDLIDALELAVQFVDADIEGTFRPSRKDWKKKDRVLFAELDGQRRRYRKLRRAYLAEERLALRAYASEKGEVAEG